MQIKSIKINLKLPIGSVEGTWEPNNIQRKASWEMYIELVTRISTNELKEGEGILREALSSFHSMFNSTRQILKHYGPDVALSPNGTISFGYLAVSILNSCLRPLLTKWHPLLTEHEYKQDGQISQAEHEKSWKFYNELRNEIIFTQNVLLEYSRILGQVAGVPSLIIKH